MLPDKKPEIALSEIVAFNVVLILVICVTVTLARCVAFGIRAAWRMLG